MGTVFRFRITPTLRIGLVRSNSSVVRETHQTADSILPLFYFSLAFSCRYLLVFCDSLAARCDYSAFTTIYRTNKAACHSTSYMDRYMGRYIPTRMLYISDRYMDFLNHEYTGTKLPQLITIVTGGDRAHACQRTPTLNTRLLNIAIKMKRQAHSELQLFPDLRPLPNRNGDIPSCC